MKTDNLKNFLHSQWVRRNHRKYHKYFDEWYSNIVPNQIIYFEREMIKLNAT